MRKLVLLIGMVLTLSACSIDNSDSEPSFVTEPIALDSVIIPEEFTFGETYNIIVRYEVPNTCYSFNRFFSEIEGNQSTIVVLNTVLTNQLCEPYNGQIAEASFEHKVENRGTYTFRFWKGKNFNGDDNYFVVEVPVTN